MAKVKTCIDCVKIPVCKLKIDCEWAIHTCSIGTGVEMKHELCNALAKHCPVYEEIKLSGN
jgi:hypothetical protein